MIRSSLDLSGVRRPIGGRRGSRGGRFRAFRIPVRSFAPIRRTPRYAESQLRLDPRSGAIPCAVAVQRSSEWEGTVTDELFPILPISQLTHPVYLAILSEVVHYEYDGLKLMRVDEKYDTSGGSIDAGDPWRTVEAATYGPGVVGNLLAKRVYTHTNNDAAPDATNDFYYAYDHVGNVRVVFDADGEEVYHFNQDAFGNELAFENYTGDSWATARAAGVTEHQTGKWIDPFTGLYFFQARWYDSGAGRFVARSIFPPMMEGAYIPFNNNPLSWADANGLMSSQEPTGITADIMLCFAAIATKNPLWQSICKDALKNWLNLPEYEEIIESLDDASPHPASRPHCYEDKCDPNNHKPPAPGKPWFPRGGGQFGPILIFPIPGTCPGCYDFPCWGGIGCSKCGWRPGGMT